MTDQIQRIKGIPLYVEWHLGKSLFSLPSSRFATFISQSCFSTSSDSFSINSVPKLTTSFPQHKSGLQNLLVISLRIFSFPSTAYFREQIFFSNTIYTSFSSIYFNITLISRICHLLNLFRNIFKVMVQDPYPFNQSFLPLPDLSVVFLSSAKNFSFTRLPPLRIDFSFVLTQYRHFSYDFMIT